MAPRFGDDGELRHETDDRSGFVLAVCALAFGVAGAGAQVTTGPLYGIDASGPLYTVDEATGATTLIGPGGEAVFSSLEYDPSAGVLYAGDCSDDIQEGEANLWSLDPESGEATLIGPSGLDPAFDPPCITGLAMDGSGTLYGVYPNVVPGSPGTTLVTFSTETGAATHVEQVHPDDGAQLILRGLAFHPTTGVLYAAAQNGNLYTIDHTNGDETVIGATNVPDGIVTGLAFGPDGTLYASDSLSLYTLDLATGASTLVGPHAGGDLEGLAYNLGGATPPMPPPGPSGPGGSGSAPADAVSTAPRFTG